jgi:hypothetical protein
MHTRLAHAFLLFTLAACGGAKESAGPALKAHADSLMAAHPEQLQSYARTPDGTVTPVDQYGLAPEGTTTSYGVVRDSAGTVLLLIETPTSPREWNVEYRHYFGPDGRTVFFRRYSGFFDGCAWGLAKEVLERSFTAEGEVADETYSITNDDGYPQDSTRCEFNFRFPYQVYPSWPEAATALMLPITPTAQ